MSELDPYLEQQYNNRAAIPEHPEYLNSWAKRSAEYRQRSQAYLDLSYGESKRELLDIFPAKTSMAPIHVFIHGGYWQALSKESFSFMAQAFNKKGECAVILNYDLCPQVSLQEIVQQVGQAILWIVKHGHVYGGDTSRIQLTGHSAGAHLLAELLTMAWSQIIVEGRSLNHPPFRRLNALSGLYQLRPLLNTSINQALGLDSSSVAECSPINDPLWHPSPSIELNLLVGALESDEYKRQSSILMEAWQQQLTMSYQQIPETHHFSILDKFIDAYYQPIER